MTHTIEHQGNVAVLRPEWDRARELLADGRRAARELGAEILRLRDLYLNRNHGGARRGSSGTNVPLEKKGGFQAELEAQLGMHHETAARLLLDLRRETQIRQIANGEVQEVVEERGGREVRHEVSPEVQMEAQRILEGLEADPRARPSRMWAGLWGKAATAGSGKAATNHGRNISRALRALATSLERWAELEPEERAELEKEWGWLVDNGLIPETWRMPGDRDVRR